MRTNFFAVKTVFPLALVAALLLCPLHAQAKGAAPQRDNAPRAGTEAPKKEELPKLDYKINLSGSGGRAHIQFSFNQRMVDFTKDGAEEPMSPEKMPFTIEPPLEGEARWADEGNLIFVSYKRMPRATMLRVTPKAGLVSLAGMKLEKLQPATFLPHPLVCGANQIRYAADGTVTLALRFSAKVDLAKLKAALKVEDPKGEALPAVVEEVNEKANDDKPGSLFAAFIKPAKLGNVVVRLPEDFTCEEGPAPIGKSRAAIKVETTSMLTINTVRARQTSSPPWERYIEVRTTNSADVDTILKYLDISPKTDISIVARSDGFLITGDFITRPRVSLTFKKGMPGLLGLLTEDFTSTVAFNDFSPRMGFDAQGTILSPNRSMRIPFSSVNVEKIQATLWQLPESNIPLMAMGFFDGYKKHLSRKVAVRTGAVNAVRNRSTESSLDLTQIAGGAKGVFLLTVADASNPRKVRPDEPYDDYDYDDYEDGDEAIASPMERLVTISDIGITARVMPDSITVWANSIATADAVRNARVRVFSANNVLLADGRTDKDGLWRHARNEDWSGRERPAVVTVSTATTDAQPKAEPGLSPASVSDIAFLKLESDLGADSAFDTGGRDYVRQGYEAFCFTPRGIFRPGETADFKIMVRDAHMQVPDQFPVAWTVRSSTGRAMGGGTAMLDAEGGAAFSLPLVPSSPTGRYTMAVSIPGKNGKTIGYCAFAVEDFQPPRIEVRLDTEKPYTMAGENITINIDAAYLFGAPAADAPWESRVTVTPGHFQHQNWRNYAFPAYFTKPMSAVTSEESGTLDDTGKAALTVTPSGDWTASMLNVAAAIRVREDGGRWVARNITARHYTTPFLLGYAYDKEEAPLAGTPSSTRIAAVTPDGEPAAISEVIATVELEESYYVRSDRGYTHAVRYVPVTEVNVPLDNGAGVLTYIPPKHGAYRIRVTDAGKTASLEIRQSAWSGVAGTSDGASPLVDRVMLSWERPRYQVGETAMLKVRSPFPGKLLVALESEKEIFRLVLPLKETETTVPVPVMASMLPNAYCSAWVIRPVNEGETWGAHRAYGVTPLLIDRSASRVNVAITAPGTTLPKGEMPVSIALTDAYGQPAQGDVTLALVDEGLLAMTNFNTPDPFAFFTAKRAMQGMSFDVYDDLMPLSTRKPVTLQAGGGAAAPDSSRMSPMTRKLELLSIFLGSVRTDGNGIAATTLKLPEYSGRGRLMAIAATRAGVGSGATAVAIARDVTVEATAPRMAAPGDTFLVPVVAFGDGKKSLNASITIETEGPLSVTGEKSFSVSLNASAAKAALPVSVKALEESGMAALKVVTRIHDSNEPPFEQRLEIPVRPPFPRLARSGGGVIRAGEKAVIDVGGGFFPGTQKVSLSFSDTPGVGLMKALDYLGSYPYGCLEQTTSAAWPYLAVPAMLKSIDPEKAKDTEFKQALDFAIRRILAMQRSDGGFNGWPGMHSEKAYAWASVYAIHFLTEAKSTGLVPQDALQAALSWMRSYLSSSLPDDNRAVMDALSVKAYITYVLTLNGDAPLGWMQFLKDQGQFLTQSARIFLAGAYAVHNGKPDALRELGTLPLPRSGRYGWSLESSPRNEALRLLLWAGVDPFAPEAALLARRVIDDGGKNRWRSTQENAMAVMAIGRYIEKTAGAGRNFTLTLNAVPPSGGASADAPGEIAAFTNKDRPTFTRDMLPPAPSGITPGAPYPLRAEVTGEGAAYYSWTTTGVPMAAPAPFAEGLSVVRRWVLPDGTVHDFIPDGSGNLPADLAALKIPHGTRVTVFLYVKPETAMNSLVLTDIVPGGFEIDNPNLVPDSEYASSAGTVIDPGTGKPFPAPKGYERAASLNMYMVGESRTEMRDDRLLLFVDYMPPRAGCFTYTLRAVNKGEFVLPPVSAEDMYDPSIRALTDTAKVVVE